MARSRFRRRIRSTLAAIACVLIFPSGEIVLLAQQDKPPAPPAGEDKTAKPPEQPAKPETPSKEAPAGEKPAVPADTAKKEPGAEQAPKITNDQLDSLVAPIALYPDALLAQVLVASTYPLELVQLQQWMAKNKTLKDKALVDAVAKQPWDTSIKSMAAFPDVVKRLSDDVQWTTDLGNAFLAQQSDVMDSVQRMRKKAQDKGALKSNEQQKVSEEKAGEPPKTVIVVESANPEVIYVPSYSPTVVYGAAVYPYPPIYYPPYPPGAAFVSFSFGVMWGAAIWGGSCCGCGWGGNDIDINVNNNFNRNEINTGGRNQVNTGDRGGAGGTGGRGGTGASAGTSDRGAAGGAGGGGGGKWQHNPSHRGGTPYSDKATASKYGGNARGDSLSQRQSNAGNRAPGGGASAGTRPSTGMGGTGAGPGGSAGRPGGGSGAGPSAGTMDRGAGGGAGGDRIGSRDIPSSSSRGGSSGRGGYSGGGFGSGGGYSGGNARSSSSRGSSSMGGRSFGGGGGGGGRRR